MSPASTWLRGPARSRSCPMRPTGSRSPHATAARKETGMAEIAPDQAVAPDLSHTPVRDFTLRSAFALAFSDVSPIVGIYSVFAIGLIAAGPAFFWGFPVVLIGQLAVTGVFGDLVSKWPFQGCVYQWARELFGARYGWFTNWAY